MVKLKANIIILSVTFWGKNWALHITYGKKMFLEKYENAFFS